MVSGLRNVVPSPVLGSSCGGNRLPSRATSCLPTLLGCPVGLFTLSLPASGSQSANARLLIRAGDDDPNAQPVCT